MVPPSVSPGRKNRRARGRGYCEVTLLFPFLKALPNGNHPLPIILPGRPAGDRREVDGVGHGGIACTVGMELVARTAGGGVWLVFGLHLAGRRVEGRAIEVDHAVEDLHAPEHLVQRLAPGVDLRP